MNMSAIHRRLVAALLCATICTIAGCGPRHPQTTRVTGTVTYKGLPVRGANVMFTGTAGRPAEAITDAAGRFTLTTFKQSDGALAGEHTVVISKYVSASNSGQQWTAVAPIANVDGDLRAPQNRPRQVIPQLYTSPSQSPLHVTVRPGEANDFPFALTD
jgi:hypothetical protein